MALELSSASFPKCSCGYYLETNANTVRISTDMLVRTYGKMKTLHCVESDESVFSVVCAFFLVGRSSGRSFSAFRLGGTGSEETGVVPSLTIRGLRSTRALCLTGMDLTSAKYVRSNMNAKCMTRFENRSPSNG